MVANDSDIVGRKSILYGCIVIFLVGSALCGAAQSMESKFHIPKLNFLAMLWLILARALEGVGAGGILAMVMIVVGDIVSLEERGLYAGYISGVVFSPSLMRSHTVGSCDCRGSYSRRCPFSTRIVAMVLLHQFAVLVPHERI